MVIPDFRQIQRNSLELYHYGMPERSGRYAWGTGDRPYQRLEGKASRMEKRLGRKLDRADRRTSSLQARANKSFDKANRRRNSIFQFRRDAAEDAFDKGYNIQEKRQRIEYKMSKKYEQYLNKFENLDLKMDKTLKKRGLDYVNRVINNTNSQYQAALMKRVR